MDFGEHMQAHAWLPDILGGYLHLGKFPCPISRPLVLFLRPIGIYLFPSNKLDSFNIHREEEIDRRKREVAAE